MELFIRFVFGARRQLVRRILWSIIYSNVFHVPKNIASLLIANHRHYATVESRSVSLLDYTTTAFSHKVIADRQRERVVIT